MAFFAFILCRSGVSLNGFFYLFYIFFEKKYKIICKFGEIVIYLCNNKTK